MRRPIPDILGDVLGDVTTAARRLSVLDVRMDGGTQPRAGLDMGYVADLVADIQAGAALPPIDVMYDGNVYWLFDGFHRMAAYRKIYQDRPFYVDARVSQGTLEDAQWSSFGVNKSHGLRRTNEDKRRAVVAALKHPNGASRSNREIARHLGVDEATVRNHREKLEVTAEIPQSAERTGADGRKINTANIGAKRFGAVGQVFESDEPQPDPNDDRPLPEWVTEDAPAQPLRSVGEMSRAYLDWLHANVGSDSQALMEHVTAVGVRREIMQVIGCDVATAGLIALATRDSLSGILSRRPAQFVQSSGDLILRSWVQEMTDQEPDSRVQSSGREARLEMFAAQFEVVLAGMMEWGDLTGRHTLTGEAERGLRKLLDVTRRELGLLKGEEVGE